MNKGYKSDKIDIDFMDKRGSGIVENQEVYNHRAPHYNDVGHHPEPVRIQSNHFEPQNCIVEPNNHQSDRQWPHPY